MPSNKNQHYVPRCYLKPFTVDGQGAAINLFNLPQERMIAAAPVKNQCSRDYFYGDDLRMETGLQPIEGAYALLVSRLLRDPRNISDGEKRFLKQFWLLQHMRTEASSGRVLAMTSGVQNIVGDVGTLPTISQRDAVQIAMRALPNGQQAIGDIKVTLVWNKSSEPFITSDDPAVLANRWHDAHRPGGGYGMKSAGALFLLPISPTLLCLCYDGGVYSIVSENGCVVVRNADDVLALNCIQLLYARSNVYMRDPSEMVAQIYESVREERARSGIRLQYAVSERAERGGRRYTVVDRGFGAEDRGLIAWHFRNPIPNAWPAFIRWRSDGVVFNNGAAVGFCRRSHAHGGHHPFMKTRYPYRDS